MGSKRVWKQIWIILLACATLNAFADTKSKNKSKKNNNDSPCTGLLSIANRPTNADSPCTAPNKKLILEGGYKYANLVETITAQAYPLGNIRYGLPSNNEITVLLPNYVHQTIQPSSGFSGAFVGLKHELFFTDKMIFSVDGYVNPPSGSRAFGNEGWGGIVRGIFSFNITKKLSFTSQLGFSSLTLPVLYGGQRYASVNPDALFSWFPFERLEIFAEIFGQSQTSPGQGSGFLSNAGIVFLVTKNITIDVEGGQRMRGLLLGVENFVGAGAVVQF